MDDVVPPVWVIKDAREAFYIGVVVVDLVGSYQDSPFLRKLHDALEISFTQHPSCRVVGGVNNDHPCFTGDCFLDGFGSHTETIFLVEG